MDIRMLSRLVAVLSVSFIFAGAALGQAPKTAAWEPAQWQVGAKDKVYVVTMAEPKRRRACTVESISADEIVCMHGGHATVYGSKDVAALIHAGEHAPWYLFFAGFLGAGVAATWGTVVLAPICPVCAVATGIAAVFFYVLAPGSAMLTDGDYDGSLLYLAPGQRLQVKVN